MVKGATFSSCAAFCGVLTRAKSACCSRKGRNEGDGASSEVTQIKEAEENRASQKAKRANPCPVGASSCLLYTSGVASGLAWIFPMGYFSAAGGDCEPANFGAENRSFSGVCWVRRFEYDVFLKISAAACYSFWQRVGALCCLCRQ